MTAFTRRGLAAGDDALRRGRDLLHALRLARVLGAAQADGRGRHALVADRPSALRARETCLAIRDAGSSSAACVVVSASTGTSVSRVCARRCLRTGRAAAARRSGSSSTSCARPRRSPRRSPRATSASSAAARSRRRPRFGASSATRRSSAASGRGRGRGLRRGRLAARVRGGAAGADADPLDHERDGDDPDRGGRACETVLLGSLLNLDAVVRRGAGGRAAMSRSSAPASRAPSRSTTRSAPGGSCSARRRRRPTPPLAAELIARSYATPLEGLNARRYGPPGLEADIEFCARENLLDTVPRFSRMVGPAAEIVAS